MARQEPSGAIGSIISELTGGNPWVFMVMPFREKFAFFKQIEEIVRDEVGLACIRADMVSASGYDLLAKIHLLIERAELVLAEITAPNPNVFYELGYAIGVQKPVVLLVEKGVDVPTDLKGREVIDYVESQEAWRVFEARLREHLRTRLYSRSALLRDMLAADTPIPAYIVASPKYPSGGKGDRREGQVYDKRTFGDNLGILGLTAAFGLILGERKGVELISAQYHPPDLLDRALSLYLIGSGKVNPPAAKMLERLQNKREPNWHFGPRPGESEQEGEDWVVRLYRTVNGEEAWVKGVFEPREPGGAKIHKEDYGIIVRGPHPDHPDRIVLIMAGPHSLGTGAACLAATRSPLIQEIKDALPEGVIEDKQRTFWVLVRGVGGEDGLLDMEGVSIVEAGVYE